MLIVHRRNGLFDIIDNQKNRFGLKGSVILTVIGESLSFSPKTKIVHVCIPPNVCFGYIVSFSVSGLKG